MSETCIGTVYNTQQYQNRLTQQINQQVAKQLGQGYSLTGAVQNTITATTQHQNSIALQVTSAATYAYQMSQNEQQQLAELVAGRSTAQATTMLLQVPDLQNVAITTNSKNNILPTDPRQIHIIWLQA